MNYVGVDVHKKYSVLCALDETGRKLREGRVEGNASNGFCAIFAGLDGPSKAVVEASWNWGLVHRSSKSLSKLRKWCWPSAQDTAHCRCPDQDRPADAQRERMGSE